MEVEELALPQKKAEEEWRAWKESLRYAKTQFARDMVALYRHMAKHGGKLIDLWEAMKTAGLNTDDDPKLAICRADSQKVQFKKLSTWTTNGYAANGGVFCREKQTGRWREFTEDTRIPKEFFPEWQKDQRGAIIREKIETVVPIIPARITNPLRSHKMENYHILWEVEKWEPTPPKDPILLRRVTTNVFLVLATWDLTPIERAVIRGRIQ